MSGAVLIAAMGGGLSVSVSPPVVSGFGIGTVTTNKALVGTVTGGSGAVTLLWTTSDPTIFPVSPNFSSSFFRMNGVDPGETYVATATLTATDSSGQTASADGVAQFTGL